MDSFFQSNLTAIIFAPIIALCIYGVVSLFARKPNSDVSQVNWRPLEAIGITLALYFVVQLLAGIMVGGVLGAIYRDQSKVELLLKDSTTVQFGFVLVVETLTAAILFWFARRRQTPLKLIGLVRPKARDIGYALLGAVVYIVIYIVPT